MPQDTQARGLVPSNLVEPLTMSLPDGIESVLLSEEAIASRIQELAAQILECLQKLNKDQREVVIMKEYEGLKFREIAEALDISENTAKSRLYYGLKSLKKWLTEANVNLATYSYE